MKLSNRVHFIDYLKVFLSFTVIAHHAGQPYGGSDGFWYVKDTGVNSDLGIFFSNNAAFNMSLYFLISAYFIPIAYEKKGKFGFLKDRLKRIGIPLLFGFLVLVPIMMYFYYINYRGYAYINFFEYYSQIYLGFGGQPLNWSGPTWPDLNFGHLWFIEHLLMYSLLYIIYRSISLKKLNLKISFNPTHKHLLFFVALISILTFIVRINNHLDNWTGAFGFIQIEYAHFPQYFAFVILGILAAKNKWIFNIPRKIGISYLMLGILLIFSDVIGIIPHSKGGLTIDSLVYSIYETLLCTLLCIGLLELFHRNLNKHSQFIEILSGNSFCVYIIHIPVLIIIQYLFINISISGYIKFGIITVACFIASHLISYFIIRKTPVISLLFSGNQPKNKLKVKNSIHSVKNTA